LKPEWTAESTDPIEDDQSILGLTGCNLLPVSLSTCRHGLPVSRKLRALAKTRTEAFREDIRQ
jgi:hypothetical protein